MTIVIHPTDISTEFLMPIYGNIPKEELTVVKGGVSKNELIELIKKHDTVLCLGHGSPFGLFSIGQFNGLSYMEYIIDKEMGPLLKDKKVVTIFCYAKKFVTSVDLHGLYTSDMFCSEVAECNLMGLGYDITQEMVDQSNYVFGVTLGKLIHLSPEEIHNAMLTSAYAELAKTNVVAAYNMERLCYVP